MDLLACLKSLLFLDLLLLDLHHLDLMNLSNDFDYSGVLAHSSFLLRQFLVYLDQVLTVAAD